MNFETHNAPRNFASETKHNEQRKCLSLLHGLITIAESRARIEYFLRQETQRLKSFSINSLLRLMNSHLSNETFSVLNKDQHPLRKYQQLSRQSLINEMLQKTTTADS